LPPNTVAEFGRDMARLQLIKEQIKQIEKARLERLRQPPTDAPHAMLILLARVYGVGIEIAEMLVYEVLVRNLRDRRAVARGACPRAGQRRDPGGGITGAPDESGARRREKGLARPTGQARGLKAHGNARVRRGMLQLAWRFLRFQQQSALVKWFQARTADGRKTTHKTMILALARKLLIALWRLVTTGEVPEGLVLRPAA
jgi:transposase